MTYLHLISRHIEDLEDRGMTHADIADKLGFNNANIVTMHKKMSTSPFPLKRIPALATLCGLTALEALRLVNARSRDFPDHATQMDQATLHWILRCGNDARKCVKAASAAGAAA